MAEEFSCPNCNSQSVIYPDASDDDERVVCRACGTILATMAQFRNWIERRRPGREAMTSGC
jgi:transcription elongation factor Elf1